ncbi:MAG: MoaD/ThiS family protein [Sulfobacillus thermotolerans]|uniref:Molybdopterin synthase sulfur carrier subunit n=1 Tax=Sulfobacillus thermotolerans TaxID=338644 RepID=A0ABM6RQ39_9FIRM|nr:molybdopterin synthase [Sulfobacillus thermotolerans]MCY0906977.1 MoaD/ThiS family protein [Sulfobacillus thermotolerans]
MSIMVLFFSFAADRMNARQKLYDLDGTMTVKEFFEKFLVKPLGDPFDAWLFSVNQEWVDGDALLHDGDEVAVVPPVSGG